MVFLLSTLSAESVNDKATELIKKHEGFSRHLYVDNNSFSIGYGTHLGNGLSREEAELLLRYRLRNIKSELSRHKWFLELNQARKTAVMDLVYNIGINGFYKFKHFTWAIRHGYYHGAANALKDSLWYSQVGKRATDIYEIIYTGKLNTGV